MSESQKHRSFWDGGNIEHPLHHPQTRAQPTHGKQKDHATLLNIGAVFCYFVLVYFIVLCWKGLSRNMLPDGLQFSSTILFFPNF